MKTAIKITAVLFCMSALFGCKKKVKGSVDLQGYIMKQCGSSVPESNATVTLGIGGADLLTATTDANGYFHMIGKYKATVCGQCGDLKNYLAFIGNGVGGGFYQEEFVSNFPNTTNFDTIYLDNSTYVQINIIGNSIVTSEKDSLWIVLPKPVLDGTWDSILIVGPIIDTILPIKEMGVFSHIGYPYYYGSTKGTPFIAPFIYYQLSADNNTAINEFKESPLPFVYGQPNNACGRVYDVTIDLSKKKL